MNDDFLKQFRKRPDPQFAEALYQRINKEKRSTWIMKRVAWTLATLTLLFVTAFAVSPTVRAATLAAMREVGILGIKESSEFPGTDAAEDTLIESEFVSLDQARARFSGSIPLPSYIPEGFELQPEARLAEVGEGTYLAHLAELTWRKEEIIVEPDQRREIFIRLSILYYPDGSQQHGLVVGEGAVEAIEINGQPAAIVRGSWSVDSREYEPFSLVNVMWQTDERTKCTLVANEELVSVEELVQMAESAP